MTKTLPEAIGDGLAVLAAAVKRAEAERDAARAELERVRRKFTFACRNTHRAWKRQRARADAYRELAENAFDMALDGEREPATVRGAPAVERETARRAFEASKPLDDRAARYTTDDRDQPNRYVLEIFQGGNGDWYVATAPEGQGTAGLGVRICTSGGAQQHAPGLARAIAQAWRAILAGDEQGAPPLLPCPTCGRPGHKPQDHAGWSPDDEGHG